MDEIKLESRFINSIVEKIFEPVLKKKYSFLKGCEVQKVYLHALDGVMQGNFQIAIIFSNKGNLVTKILARLVLKLLPTPYPRHKYKFIETIDIEEVSFKEKNGSYYVNLNLNSKLKEAELVSFLNKFIE